MRRLRASCLFGFVSTLVSILLVAVPTLAYVQPVYAVASPSAPSLPTVPPVVGPPSPDQTRTAPVEITARRTETTKHFLMPDGSCVAWLYAAPVHYKAADGTWRDIDDTLVSAGPGVMRNAGAQTQVEIANAAAASNLVRIARDGWSVGMGMVGGRIGAQKDKGDTATFSDVATATDLRYETIRGDLKETLVLKSPAAPASFSFRMNPTGLELRACPGGGWAFFRPAAVAPSLYLGPLTVFDSAAEPTSTQAASMTVTPSGSGAIVTYNLPRTWLDDPVRVFPVNVDPTLYISSSTYVSSVPSATAHGTEATLVVGYSSGSYVYEGYVRAKMASAGIPAGGYIDSADLQILAKPTGGETACCSWSRTTSIHDA